MRYKTSFLTPVCFLLYLSACDMQDTSRISDTATPPVALEKTGWLDADELNEASGLQASYTYEGDFFVHNDEGKSRVYVIDSSGNDLGDVRIEPAKNKDWEDITSVPVGDERWLVAGDIGDNARKRKYITLYFAKEPAPGKKGRYSGRQVMEHRLDLTYPDGPRDCEAMSYDPVSGQILLLSKRDKPARLYAVDLQTALTEREVELEFLGTISALRPPTIADRAKWGGRVDWISQPTGLDIAADGSEAVVITYRSLYRFKRNPDEDWLTAMQRKPTEVVGPPAPQNESVAYSTDGKSIYVTSEKLPAPVFRIQFNDDL
jgi:hypothetical protein